MPTTLLAYSSTPTNLIPQTNKYVIYKHKICLFRTYNCKDEIEYLTVQQGLEYLTYHKKENVYGTF